MNYTRLAIMKKARKFLDSLSFEKTTKKRACLGCNLSLCFYVAVAKYAIVSCLPGLLAV